MGGNLADTCMCVGVSVVVGGVHADERLRNRCVIAMWGGVVI